ncbi:hypothetical protein Pcinc_024972 [Petrolisthes cinctipes]|uniref:Uncharacterized protein n=1 Tax=Petrolisthes cinctipes TaxID=88211 RepID=A0AAE1F8T1_PETCI|nr:hypothetical protein Pcinc_024972 [Petrolisthes cinctipes]
MKVNERINECARILSDGKLLAKLSGGDVVAQELKYHAPCLVALYNQERDFLSAQEREQAQHDCQEAHPIAFSELVTYINGSRMGMHGRAKKEHTMYNRELRKISGGDLSPPKSEDTKVIMDFIKDEFKVPESEFD